MNAYARKGVVGICNTRAYCNFGITAYAFRWPDRAPAKPYGIASGRVRSAAVDMRDRNLGDRSAYGSLRYEAGRVVRW